MAKKFEVNLDDFEKELLQSVENGEWVSKGNIENRKKELQCFLSNQKI